MKRDRAAARQERVSAVPEFTVALVSPTRKRMGPDVSLLWDKPIGRGGTVQAIPEVLGEQVTTGPAMGGPGLLDPSEGVSAAQSATGGLAVRHNAEHNILHKAAEATRCVVLCTACSGTWWV